MCFLSGQGARIVGCGAEKADFFQLRADCQSSLMFDCNKHLQIVRPRDLNVTQAQLCCVYAPARCMLATSSCGTAPIVER